MTDNNQWIYYNNAIIPTCAPHEEPDLTSIENGLMWKNLGRKAVFARWTSNFDKTENSSWWYIIQDKPFDLITIKKSHRRRINLGLRNFECKLIDPKLHFVRMTDIAISAWDKYPLKYKPKHKRERLLDSYYNFPYLTFGCFNNDNLLCSFIGVEDRGNHWFIVQSKTDPLYEKGLESNAAMIYSIINYLRVDIINGKYLTNGARNIVHETNFNEDLCHYYGFRKVYCDLHISFNPKYKWIVLILFPLRNFILNFREIKLINSIYQVLKMEEISRNQMVKRNG